MNDQPESKFDKTARTGCMGLFWFNLILGIGVLLALIYVADRNGSIGKPGDLLLTAGELLIGLVVTELVIWARKRRKNRFR